MRTAVLVPWAIPTIVSAKMWDWMLQQQFGIINLFLVWLGFERIAFTTDYPMLSVLIADVWKNDTVHGFADFGGFANVA